ncbi:MAG: hypothetical protein JEY94_11515 [Melioribacteraceae bacterium]|nr:hypothetical protein [Melioribacteraceae bacterium]
MKNFKLNLILRILILIVTIFLLFASIFIYNLLIAIILLSFLIVLETYSLIKYVDTTNTELSRFLFSIKYSDFSQSFTQNKLGGSFSNLNNAFNEVIAQFRKTRNEKEEHLRYLQTVVQHINIGLIAYTNNGEVELINKAAKRLLDIRYLKSILTLKNQHPDLLKILSEIKPNEKRIVKLEYDMDSFHILVYTTEFRLRGQIYSMVALQNIQSELEEQEMAAWQKLIRVLTHEIMNSVTPISSLAGTVKTMLDSNKTDLTGETRQDVNDAINTIQKRSDGLIKFVNQYRSLTKIPTPNFEQLEVKNIFNEVLLLLKEDVEKYRINIECEILPSNIKIYADRSLIEQVFINLIVNAIHALKNSANPLIILKAHNDIYGNTVLSVTDNGVGITENVLDKVFIPFFSTKTEGSGIGLSLSKQIIRAHNGIMKVSSKLDAGTTFTIRL